MLSGKVAATLGGYWNYEALQLQLMHKHPVTIPIDQAGVPTYNELVLVVREEQARTDGQDLRAFLQALTRGERAVRADPAAAAALLVKANPSLEPKLQLASIQQTLPAALPSGGHPYGYQDPIRVDGLRQLDVRPRPAPPRPRRHRPAAVHQRVPAGGRAGEARRRIALRRAQPAIGQGQSIRSASSARTELDPQPLCCTSRYSPRGQREPAERCDPRDPPSAPRPPAMRRRGTDALASSHRPERRSPATSVGGRVPDAAWARCGVCRHRERESPHSECSKVEAQLIVAVSPRESRPPDPTTRSASCCDLSACSPSGCSRYHVQHARPESRRSDPGPSDGDVLQHYHRQCAMGLEAIEHHRVTVHEPNRRRSPTISRPRRYLSRADGYKPAACTAARPAHSP